MEWYGYVLLVAGLLIVAFIFFLIGMLYRTKVAEREIGSAEALAPGIIDLQRAGFGCGNAFIKAW